MNNIKNHIGSKFLLICILCLFPVTIYAKPNDSIKNIEINIESLKKENDQLREEVERLEKTQYQNIRQYHDDVSSDVNTYMTWVGIIAAILAMVVTAVSIAIPLLSNKRFEKKFEDMFKSFKDEQEKWVRQNSEEQDEWKTSLEQVYQKRFSDVLNKMKGIKKNVIEIQEQTRMSERRAWVSQMLSEANREINEKKFDVAIRLCTHVLEKDATNDVAYNTRGIAYGELKKYELAIKDFGAAISNNPQKHYYSNRALARINNGEINTAILDYDEALKLDSTDDTMFASRGFAYHLIKDYKNAILSFDEAIKINHENASYYVNRGTAKFMINDFAGAIEDFGKGIELDNKNPLFYYNRGNARFQLNNYSDAIDDFTEAIKLDDKSYEFFFSRGLTKIKVNDVVGAINDFDSAILLNDKDDALFNERGNAKMLIKNYEGAANDFESAISIRPDDYIYLYNRGNSYLHLKKYNEAILDYDKAFSLNGKDPEILINRGNAKIGNGNTEEAIADYDNAIIMNDKKPNYYFIRANAKWRMNNLEGVIEDCNKAISLDENTPDYYMLRGSAEYGLEDYEMAIGSYKMGVSKGYSKAEAYNMLAYCYLNQNKYAEAMAFINRAIRLTNNKNGIFIDTRGEIYMAQSDLNSALDDFNTAIKLVTDNYELYAHRALCYKKMAELETDINAKGELVSNAEADDIEVETLKRKGENVNS